MTTSRLSRREATSMDRGYLRSPTWVRIVHSQLERRLVRSGQKYVSRAKLPPEPETEI